MLGSIPRRGKRCCSSLNHPGWLWGQPKSPIQWRPGVKQPGCEEEHSPESSAEGINGALSIIPPYAFMGYTGTTIFLLMLLWISNKYGRKCNNISLKPHLLVIGIHIHYKFCSILMSYRICRLIRSYKSYILISHMPKIWSVLCFEAFTVL
jgi:hypothetical protein